MTKNEFWLHVDNSHGLNSCWLWKLSHFPNGYGQVNYNGKNIGAHTLSFFLTYGFWAKPFCCHVNDCNKRCVNPKHLYAGTNKENQDDVVRLGNNLETKITKCPLGHEYTLENTYIQGNHRSCIICRRRNAIMRYHKYKLIKGVLE